MSLGQQEPWKSSELQEARVGSEARGLEGKLEAYSVGEKTDLSVFRLGAAPRVFERRLC